MSRARVIGGTSLPDEGQRPRCSGTRVTWHGTAPARSAYCRPFWASPRPTLLALTVSHNLLPSLNPITSHARHPNTFMRSLSERGTKNLGFCAAAYDCLPLLVLCFSFPCSFPSLQYTLDFISSSAPFETRPDAIG